MENNGEQAPFVPFTKAERIQQLGEMDKNIVSLLRSTGQAVESLGKREAQGEDASKPDDDHSKVFNNSMNDFLRTLRAVNVGMKRQIWGLEEAHIISLDKKNGQNTSSEGGESQATSSRNGPLAPDGDGKIGGLDVGWLNSRSSKVERDMESDLWDEAESWLKQLIQHCEQNPDGEGSQSTS